MSVTALSEANGMEGGSDLADLLRVDHYEEVKEQLQPAMGNPLNADAMGAFLSYIPKSNEERLQGLTEYFKSLRGRPTRLQICFASLPLCFENLCGLCG